MNRMSSAWSFQLSQAYFLAVTLPACMSPSNDVREAAILPAEQAPESYGLVSPKQDPSKATPPQADEPMPPSPRWLSLHGPMKGQQDSDGATFFYESVEFDTEASAPATMRFAGLRYAHCGESWAFDAALSSPRVTVDDELGDESGAAFFVAAGASTNWMMSDSFALQPHLVIGYGQCQVSLPLQSAPGRADTDLEWFQSDLTLTASYLPSADSEYALFPSGGLGFRYIDGFHDYANGSTREFDAVLPYGFVGMHWSQCVGASSRWAIEATAMFGQLEGIQISFSFFL